MNQDFDKVDNLIFLTTEAFSNYMAQQDHIEIKPMVFEAEEEICRKKKANIHIVTDSDSVMDITPLL